MSAALDIPTDLVLEQTRQVLKDIQPTAIKMGMIGAADNYRILAELFQTQKPACWCSTLLFAAIAPSLGTERCGYYHVETTHAAAGRYPSAQYSGC